MASMVYTLSATVSRLTLFRKPSIYVHSNLSRLVYPFLHNSFNPISAHLSSFSKAQAINSSVIVEDLVVLGIETSCDDTAAAIVRSNGEILSQVLSSQADLLARYGGVAPKMAKEAHAQVIDQVVQETLDLAKLTEEGLSAVAVTIGPGLSLSLRVGVRKARKLAGTYALPIIGVHHMEAHALVASHYIQLGTTIDDAIGEAYDKTAKWLGLDLRKSWGPALEELAEEGDPNSVKFK